MDDTEMLSSACARPRLALVTETWPPEINGVAMTLSNLVAGMRSRDWQVDLVRPVQQGESVDGSAGLLVPGLPIPGYQGLRFGLPVAGRLQRYWGGNRPDVVHVATEGPLGWAALRVASALRIPLTSSFHTNFHRYCKHYRLAWLRGAVTRHLRLFHNRTACTMVPNLSTRDYLQQEGYRNVVILGRGVDHQLYARSRRDPSLRRAWQVEEDALAVLHVGRMAPEKNLDTVLEAFARIQTRHPSARMVWVGDGPELAKIRRACPHHVFAGARVGEDLARHYASADLFLFSSLTETYGNVVVEAMASGLPVLAYDYAAAAIHIRNGENGMLAPFGDRAGFVRLALALSSMSPSVRRQMGIAASDSLAASRWEEVCDQFERYLNDAIRPVEF